MIMAVLRKSEIKKMSVEDMEKNVHDFLLELAKERASIAVGATVTSPGRVRELRKAIARIKTRMNELKRVKKAPAKTEKVDKK